MITVETYLPVQGLAPKQLLNPPSNNFANLDFHKADWPDILLALRSIDWGVTPEPIPPSLCFYYFIDILYNKCLYHVPSKNRSKTKSLNSI